MVNNYPEYAAGVNYKKTDSNGNRHFYSAQVVADPANETVESKLIKDGVVIDEGGGGGTSDFTTAEVEFTVTGGEAVSMGFACIDNDSIKTDGAVVAGTYTLPLYKGSLTMSLLEQATVTITGSATYNEDDGFIIITGNCSIALDITK